jgi:hypothetical protein
MHLTSEKAKEMGAKSNRKGVPNKTTKEIREIFQLLLENNLEKIQDDLDQMAPEIRVKAILNLAKFVLPTLKATELLNSKENIFEISFID